MFFECYHEERYNKAEITTPIFPTTLFTSMTGYITDAPSNSDDSGRGNGFSGDSDDEDCNFCRNN